MKIFEKAVKPLVQACVILFLFSMVSCSLSKKIELDPKSKDFYDTARLIMTKQEREIFNHLPDRASREQFINNFWAKRDPDPATEENEFKEEFYRRIEYANARFKEGPPGWKTDRGRIYIYLGAPDKIEQHPFINLPNVKGVILWVYYRYGFAVEFINKRGGDAYTLDPYSGTYGSFFDALEQAKIGFISEEGATAKKFIDFDLEYNKEKKEIAISIPAYALTFKEEGGLLKADFEFEFFVYEKRGSSRDKIRQTRHLETTEDEILQMEDIVFTFPFDLMPGKYIVDVIIIEKPDLGKARKIFEIKI